jgi:3-oxoacyl-[acyl-carrier-protein] synthase II
MIYCELDELAAAYRACVVDGKFDFARWGTHAMPEMYPLWLLKYLPNMVASHVGIAHDARGPTNAITLGEVSAPMAIAEAVRVIERGQADVMIAGGASSRNHPSIWIFRDDRLMSHRRDEPERASRPFDAGRDGMVAGEGAGAVVLESRRHASARGAKILGTIRGQASSFELLRNGTPSESTAVRRAIERALADANLSPADIDHVNAAGLSTLWHDRLEAQAIRQVLGDAPVTAPTSYFGNLGAAAGAVELVASVLALRHRQIPATLNYETPDAECPVNVVHNSPAVATKRAAISLNISPRGQTAALVVSD